MYTKSEKYVHRGELKHIQSSVVFVVSCYCSNDDVEYGFNFKLSGDKTAKLIHFFFRTNIGVKSTLVD